jgi:hypothetical protein
MQVPRIDLSTYTAEFTAADKMLHCSESKVKLSRYRHAGANGKR